MRSWIIPPFDPSEVSRAFHGKDAFVRRERREGGEEGEKEEGREREMLSGEFFDCAGVDGVGALGGRSQH